MDTLDNIFQEFLRERTYLNNVNPKTRQWYETAWKAFARLGSRHFPRLRAPHSWPVLISNVSSFTSANVVSRPISCNCWVRAMNSFATWLHERGAISESVRICPQKVEKRLLAVHTETALRTILSYRPKTYIQWRVYAIACAIPDAGCRIDELLSVSIGDFDFDKYSF